MDREVSCSICAALQALPVHHSLSSLPSVGPCCAGVCVETGVRVRLSGQNLIDPCGAGQVWTESVWIPSVPVLRFMVSS